MSHKFCSAHGAKEIGMNNKKQVIIVGAGIAGLSAGVYALNNGFDVTILESHSIPGGNCTSWKRKGYLFEGGMHWLTGSKKGAEFNKEWYEVGALSDDMIIHNREPFMEYSYDGTNICLYRDVDKTQKHLTELSPEDATVIEKLCNGIRTAMTEGMPMDIFASHFKHKGIRELFVGFSGSENAPIAPFFYLTFSTLATGDGGFPEGGSLPFAQRIANKVTDLGGKILYKTKVDKVLVEEGKATGVLANGQTLKADAVIVSSDTMMIESLFEKPITSPWLEKMRSTAGPTMNTYISLGIDADLTKYPAQYMFKIDEPVDFVGNPVHYISVNNYANDPAYSPAGKTSMTTSLGGNTYDFWLKAKQNGTYAEEKKKLGDSIIKAIESQMPEIKGKVEICDVATPLTYERYCGTWKGSWMTDMTQDMSMEPYPATVDGINCLYFAGQRMMPPGGLPVALITGKIAVQYLCEEMKQF